MRLRGETQDTTLTRSKSLGGQGHGELRLLVSADGVLNAYLIGDRTTVRIGRDGENDVVIPHPSVSRRHAELMISPLSIRDLGSSNGTIVGARRIPVGARVPVALGEAVDIGDVAILLHRISRSEPMRPRVSTRFERLLVATCDSAARTGTRFAIARLQVAAEHAPALIDAVAASLVAADTLAEREPGVCHVLFADSSRERAAGAVRDTVARLAAGGVVAHGGIASWPADGVSAEQLAARTWQSMDAPEGAAPTAMDRVRALTAQIADSQLSVLIRGETGVGKELLAEMIHRLSARAARPFLKVNCAALSDALLESELFGHERGAFTGATVTKRGLLDIADGGTVFLDEIGELPMAVQAKLLHVLEDRVVKRVGGVETRTVDIRFVAATNRAVDEEIAHGRFRRDLYFRLSGVTLELPPLRERRNEIEGLARTFVAFASEAAGRPAPELGDDVLAALIAAPWPGNIRELRHTLERSILLCGDGPLTASHLRIGADIHGVATLLERTLVEESTPTERQPSRLHDQVASLERDRIREALARCGGNQTHAARLLGIARGTLRARMRDFGLMPRR